MTTESRVHPSSADAPPPSIPSPVSSPKRPNNDGQVPSKHVSPPKTFIVQFPREQILRYPPPENERKFKNLVLRKKRRSCCCCSICCFLLFIVAMVISAGVLYLVYRFDSQKYAVVDLAIKGMNLTSSSPLSPEFDVVMRMENPNEKVGIYYLQGGAVRVLYDDLELSDGVIPTFSQLKNNVTALQTTLKGSDVVLGRTLRTTLMKSQSEGTVPLLVKLKAPVKFKVGSVTTWDFTVRIWCGVVVDSLNETAIIISEDCDYRIRLW